MDIDYIVENSCLELLEPFLNNLVFSEVTPQLTGYSTEFCQLISMFQHILEYNNYLKKNFDIETKDSDLKLFEMNKKSDKSESLLKCNKQRANQLKKECSVTESKIAICRGILKKAKRDLKAYSCMICKEKTYSSAMMLDNHNKLRHEQTSYPINTVSQVGVSEVDIAHFGSKIQKEVAVSSELSHQFDITTEKLQAKIGIIQLDLYNERVFFQRTLNSIKTELKYSQTDKQTAIRECFTTQINRLQMNLMRDQVEDIQSKVNSLNFDISHKKAVLCEPKLQRKEQDDTPKVCFENLSVANEVLLEVNHTQFRPEKLIDFEYLDNRHEQIKSKMIFYSGPLETDSEYD